jgi:chemotaxis protein CheC
MTQPIPNEAMIKNLQKLVSIGFKNAARGFSDMVGESYTLSDPTIRLVPLSEIPFILGGPENDAVGIYLRIHGDLNAQVMLVFPYDKALEMVDMLLGLTTGTTNRLGSLERSALGEVGNLTGTFFFNAISQRTGVDARPTPPAVMVDMVGAILDVIIAAIGEVAEFVLMFETKFQMGERETPANFWISPDPETLQKLTILGSRQNE